ncbi:DUF5134 domain-containing protein [Streptomyces sp. RB6PN25]|uniref:DUF5134 domain-containing protein n=1 Tax=Streptomyces humicola TaxID=2953240 RepID=A0ABT1PTQ1_9ACTN|nr:DUF5134 domain-containing protein [Streptomyces humicola]MCQ4081060.1 DUF5134 domain-containing protein [Streptomyces humicola]
MASPSWLTDTFAAIMLVIALSCVARLLTSSLRRREVELDADAVHLVMGISMAGMLVPRLDPAPNGVWDAAFALAAAWFAARTVRAWRGNAATGWRCPHPLPHLVESGAMLYMLLAAQNPAPDNTGKSMAMPGMGATAGTGLARFPALALLLAVFMVGYVVWLGDRLTLVSPASTGRAARSADENPAGSSGDLGWITRANARTAARGTAGCGTQPTGHTSASGRTILAPRAAACYKIAMGITMGYMLVTML